METPEIYVPVTGGLGIVRRAVPMVAMHLTAYGQDAEASIRHMCSGALPVVGQRYVWVCTGVNAPDADLMQADFQLLPLEEQPHE